jgi:exopolysaccharide biosynthesis polyprenyl glycosylphosphotransferase
MGFKISIYLSPRPERSCWVTSEAELIKRGFDILVSWTLLVLGVPIFLIIALLIKLTSKGPVIYKQVRLGKDGKPFNFYKFRSMYVNSNPEIHKNYVVELIKNKKKYKGVYKIKDDPRVTPVGRVLRKFSLDELPQFFNVLRGEMSIVGPRPPLPYEVEHYKDWQKKRLHVKPGITGLWQVSGRTLLPFDEMVKLDIEYIKRQSFALDFVIFLKTIPVIFNGKGAF